MRLMDVMMSFMWSPLWAKMWCVFVCVIVCRRNFERWLWALNVSFGAVWERKELEYTDKIQSTKGQCDSSKDGLSWLLSSSSLEIIMILVFFLYSLVSHSVLFMQLLTTLIATKQLHFNPFRNHFGSLTNDASPVRLHSVSHLLYDWSFGLRLSSCKLIQNFWHVRWRYFMNGCDDE